MIKKLKITLFSLSFFFSSLTPASNRISAASASPSETGVGPGSAAARASAAAGSDLPNASTCNASKSRELLSQRNPASQSSLAPRHSPRSARALAVANKARPRFKAKVQTKKKWRKKKNKPIFVLEQLAKLAYYGGVFVSLLNCVIHYVTTSIQEA